MRYLMTNLFISTWLLVSQFVLPRTPRSMVVGGIAALVFLVLGFASLALERARYVTAAAALVFLLVAVLVPDLPAAVRLNHGFVASVTYILALELRMSDQRGDDVHSRAAQLGRGAAGRGGSRPT